MHRGLRWWNVKEKGCLKDQGIDRRILLVEPEGERLQQEDTITMDPKEKGWEGVK